MDFEQRNTTKLIHPDRIFHFLWTAFVNGKNRQIDLRFCCKDNLIFWWFNFKRFSIGIGIGIGIPVLNFSIWNTKSAFKRTNNIFVLNAWTESIVKYQSVQQDSGKRKSLLIFKFANWITAFDLFWCFASFNCIKNPSTPYYSNNTYDRKLNGWNKCGMNISNVFTVFRTFRLE